MTMWLLPDTTRDEVLQLIGVKVNVEEALELPVELAEIVQPEVIQDLSVDSAMQQMLGELDNGEHRIEMESPELRDLTLPLESLADVSDAPFIKGDFGGRSSAGKRAAVAMFGGNADSERSVSLGLKWLKSIQQSDGSWSFANVGEAGGAGNLTTTDMGATSLALLCFLGAGHTFESMGEYQQTVRNGLAWMVKNADRGASGADLRGRFRGNSGMYVQGIATICICEASALSPKDKELRRLATDAVKFIERAQDKVGGGWRYQPGDRGDTSVVGWQLMALRSAKECRISLQSDTIKDAKEFLDSAGTKDGAMYGYMPGDGPRDSMTAVGLLCRIYHGWKRERPALKVGVEHLASVGPKRGDIYYNYYATQVLHHWGGDLWKQWNHRMRDELVTSQVKEGPAAGSWDVTDPHGYAGGRIYQTTLSILTLEVYYRHLPMYHRFDEKSGSETPDKSE